MRPHNCPHSNSLIIGTRKPIPAGGILVISPTVSITFMTYAKDWWLLRWLSTGRHGMETWPLSSRPTASQSSCFRKVAPSTSRAMAVDGQYRRLVARKYYFLFEWRGWQKIYVFLSILEWSWCFRICHPNRISLINWQSWGDAFRNAKP